jgi:PAS domain S-box-containing protein
MKEQFTQTIRIDLSPDMLEDVEKGPAIERKEPDKLSSPLSDSRYQNLMESLYDGILLADLHGTIVDTNARAGDILHATDLSDIKGMSILDIIVGASNNLFQGIEDGLAEKRYLLLEAYCHRLDETAFPAEIAISSIFIDDEGWLLLSVRDITIRKNAQLALEEANASLEAHDRARSQFISNVSHELRTPLTSMMYGVANLLRGVAGPLPDRIEVYMERLNSDCKRLLATVNDILDLRRAEDNRLVLNKSKIPFGRLAVTTADSLRVQAEARNQQIRLQGAGRLLFVKCDPNKMERVILNIFNNALKFTPEGGLIELIVRDDIKDGYVTVQVIDNGPGIPAEDLEHVMDRYYRVGELVSGTGLGLSISKEIVELHHGEITIDSPPPGREQGTIVTLHMPIIDPPTVLVVDDEPVIRDVIKLQLNNHGYNVVTAKNGREALEIIEGGEPDMAIVDVMMPDMDGTELIKTMKESTGHSKIPVMVLTGGQIDREKYNFFNSFSIPVLQKPWKDEELLREVDGAFVGRAVFQA